MSTISDFNQKSHDENDAEHRVQVELLQALCDAVQKDSPPSMISDIFQQLVDYSKAHFLSEELLMRQMSYDDYEDHISDHVRMLDALDEIAAAQASGKSVLVSGKAESILKFIKQHIATRDQRFADFLRGVK
jgi:hemerythrin-like metal-binding protein